MRLLLLFCWIGILASCIPQDGSDLYQKYTGDCEFDQLLPGWTATVVTPTSGLWTPCDNAFVNARKGVVVGTDGQIRLTENGGEDWENRSKLPNDWKDRRLDYVAFPDPLTLYLGNNHTSTLLVSRDAGATFSSFALGDNDRSVLDLAFFDAQHGLAMLNAGGYGTRGELRRTLDGGQQWEVAELPGEAGRLSTHLYSDFGVAYCMATDTAGGELLLRYTPEDGWESRSLGTIVSQSQSLQHLALIDEQTLIAHVDDSGGGWFYSPKDQLHLSQDGGLSWRPFARVEPGEHMCGYYDSAQEGVVFVENTIDLSETSTATGSDKTPYFDVYYTADSGSSWRRDAHPISCSLNGPTVRIGAGQFLLTSKDEWLLFERE